jgi:high-affinity Fe2+/Pb2+ permease
MDDPTTVTKTPTEVRQGETTGVVRWVLGLSLFGAIVALVLTFLFVRGV